MALVKSGTSSGSSSGNGVCPSLLREQYKVAQYRIVRWHSYQLLLFAVIFLSSTVAAFCLSYAFLPLQPDCLLFSTWNLTVDHVSKTVYIPYEQIQWGHKASCNLSLYTQVASALASFMICWFFGFFRPRRETYRRRSHSTASTLVLPTLIIAAIFTIFTLVTWATLLSGILHWCQSFSSLFDSCQIPPNYEVKPSWEVRLIDYFGFVIASLICDAVGCALWLAVVISLSLRWLMHIDFPKFAVANKTRRSVERAIVADSS